MPGMDGYEATKRIRENEAAVIGSRRVPIVALTADVLPGTREKCKEAGMDGFLTKPIDEEQMYKILSEQLTARKQPLMNGHARVEGIGRHRAQYNEVEAWAEKVKLLVN